MGFNNKKRGEPSFNSGELRGRIRETKNGTLYISSTSFLSFAKCAYQAYHTKYLQRELEEGPKVAALCFGIAMHEALERYNRLYYSQDDALSSFYDCWMKYYDVDMLYTEAERDHKHLMAVGIELFSRIVAVHESEEVGHPYKLRDGTLAVEKQDTYRISPRLYLGRTFDLVAPVKGIPTIIDYKTSAKMYTKGNQDEINEQLTAYLLPHRLRGVPQVEQAAFLVGTKTQNPRGKLFIVRRDEKRLEQFLEDMEATAKMIRSGLCVRNRNIMSCGTSKKPYCVLRGECYGTKE